MINTYKATLLNNFADAIDNTLADFVENMPKSYFETNDEQTILQHLSAILAAKTAGNQEQIILSNNAGNQQTFIHFNSYPGLLKDILNQISPNNSIELARAFTASDNSIIIDMFDFADTTRANRKVNGNNLAVAKSGFNFDSASCHAKQVQAFIGKVNEYYLSQFSEADIIEHAKLVNRVKGTLDTATILTRYQNSEHLFYLSYAAGQIGSTTLFNRLCRYFCSLNIDIREAYLENFDTDTQKQTALVVLLIDIKHQKQEGNTKQLLHEFTNDLERLPYLDQSTIDLCSNDKAWTPKLAEVLITLCHLAHQVNSNNSLVTASKEQIKQTAIAFGEIAMQICELFVEKFSGHTNSHTREKYEHIEALINEKVADSREAHILKLINKLSQASLKTNLNVENRYALALKVSPEVFLSSSLNQEAFGVFYVHGKAFDGFHVRFQDIARGGVRIVQPQSTEQYGIEANRLFEEVYGLSYAQQLKNKDIPEGGSKGVILVRPEADAQRCAKAYINSLLDLIIDANKVAGQRIDYYTDPEFLFLGPDENVTNDLIDWIINRAEQRNYLLPSAFMSSKPNAGINHKQYGVTSEGLAVFLDVGLRTIGIEPKQQDFSIKLTGGPDGDVAGNLIKILHREYGNKAKIIGVADGSGCGEDPAGLCHQELMRLVEHNLPIADFDKSKLSALGQVISVAEKGGSEARNTMHNRLQSDVFIPAGGRPATINKNNYKDFVQTNGLPSSRLIIEGANLYLTQEAREELEAIGTLIIKDSSANKCGVICSSYEIMASLLLTEGEFLQIKDAYVAEVLIKLREYAEYEAKTLYKEHYLKPSESLTKLSLKLSAQINKTTDVIANLILAGKIDQAGFIRNIMIEFLPTSLFKKVEKDILNQLPTRYLVRAMSSALASRIIYHEGINYLDALAEQELANHIIRYLKQEEKINKLLEQLGQSDLADKTEIMYLLKKGGTGTALHWNE